MSDEQPKFANVAVFVEEYLGQIYQRQVSDSTDTVWCDEWWRHVEAATRLNALWRSWEQLHRDERGGLSYWLLQHADPHMKRLFDPRGPFKYCGVRHGHRDMLGPLPIESPPDGVFADMNADPPTDRMYSTVVDFVENYLSLIYQRQVTDLSDTVWCPQWWQHQEAVVRLDALWRAWEFYRTDPSEGLSRWFLEHADPQMAQLFNPRGPFKYCTVRGGHQSKVSPLPVTMEKQGMFTDPAPEQ
ncbi:DUF4913 domain-containing protein [Nocardia sp. NPDC005366]|uniref:DUF4913 domain-containing protein n=1 Tax=Nocardia sp. NPDC005366 TaxID=3156878 RepID=UPI0033A38B6C